MDPRDRRQTLDDVLQVDVRRLNKQGLLRAGQGGTITWHSGGEATGSIRFACTQRALELRYRRRSSTPDCPPVTQSIAFDRTACNLGGSRVWLLGPHCTPPRGDSSVWESMVLSVESVTACRMGLRSRMMLTG